MDEFKRYNVDFLTAYDLNAWCVGYNPKTRRELMKMANKRARRRLREQDRALSKMETTEPLLGG